MSSEERKNSEVNTSSGTNERSSVKIYKIKDFIRVNKDGQLDFDRSVRVIHELAATAAFHTDHNLLIDLRDTTVALESMNQLLDLAIEFARFKSIFKNKIASVIPNDDKRAHIADGFKLALKIKGFQYDYFTDFEDAIEWLSDTTRLNTNNISPLYEE
jgi:hypothetical protein